MLRIYSSPTDHDTLYTSDYPYSFPNFMDCSFVLESLFEDSFVRLTIVDAAFMDPTSNCSTDYIQLFDGNTPSAPLLARICHNTTNTYDSTGQRMLVKCISDSNLGAKGAQINYQEVWIHHGVTKYLCVIFLMSVIGGSIFLSVIIYCVKAHRKKSGSAAI